jgi:hypothetical protein
MFTALAVVLSLVLMSMGNRLRGGLWGSTFPWGDTVSRLLWWGGSTAVASLLLGAPWYAALALIVAQWATATIPLFSSIDLGHDEGTFWGDFGLLTLRGVLGATGVAVVLFGVNHFTATHFLWWPVLLIGALESVAYTIGWTVAKPAAVDTGFNEPTEIGELIYGALIAAGLAVGLLG